MSEYWSEALPKLRAKGGSVKAKIAVLAGDGVGREIVPEAVKVLKVVGEKFGHSFEFANGDIGGQAIDKVGVPLPQDTLMLAKQSDAVLLGAVGGPKWEGLDYSLRPERALLGLREALGLYANLRPAKLYPNLADASTLKREIVEGIEVVTLSGDMIGGEPVPEPFAGSRDDWYGRPAGDAPTH